LVVGRIPKFPFYKSLYPTYAEERELRELEELYGLKQWEQKSARDDRTPKN